MAKVHVMHERMIYLYIQGDKQLINSYNLIHLIQLIKIKNISNTLEIISNEFSVNIVEIYFFKHIQ